MKDALRAQFKDMQELHTPRADFVRGLEARLQAAPVKEPVSEHFPAQLSRAYHTFVGALVPARLAPVAQRLSTLLLVFGIAIGGWIGAVSASYNSVPGEVLYNVKRATEKAQIVAVEATGNNAKAAALHTNFAERRVAEVQQVITQNKSPEQAQTAVTLLTKSLASASEALEQVDTTDTATEKIEAASQVLSNTERIAASLSHVLDTLPPNVIDLIDELVTVQGTVTEQRLSALQDIVRAQLEGTDIDTNEDINQIIITALQKVSEESQSIALRAQALPDDTVASDAPTNTDADPTTSTGDTAPVDATTTPATATTSTVGSSTAAVSSSPTATTTSLPSTLPDINPEDASPVDVVPHIAALTSADIHELSSAVQADVQEVSTLIEQGQLIEALEKAKEVTLKQRDISIIVKKAAITTQESAVADDITEEAEKPIDAATTTDATTTTETEITTTTTINNQTSSTTQ